MEEQAAFSATSAPHTTPTTATSSSLPTASAKTGSGVAVRSQSQAIILNVSKYMESEKRMPLKRSVTRTAEATGVSERTLRRIKLRAKVDPELHTPGKKRVRAGTAEHIDDFTRGVIRRKMHSMYLRNELPTLKKLHTKLRADADFTMGKQPSGKYCVR